MKIRGRCLSAFKPSSCLDSMHKKSKSKNRFPTINSILVQACLYIYVFFLVVGRNIIFALRYHQPSPEISYHFCSEDFLGIPSAIKTNQIRLDPKQMIRIPTDWWNPMVRKWCFWGFVRGCVHGTHSWQLLSLGSMLKAVYFQLETWVSNPNRLLSTTGGLRQQTTGGYTVCTWYPLASFPLTKWHV